MVNVLGAKSIHSLPSSYSLSVRLSAHKSSLPFSPLNLTLSALYACVPPLLLADLFSNFVRTRFTLSLPEPPSPTTALPSSLVTPFHSFSLVPLSPTVTVTHARTFSIFALPARTLAHEKDRVRSAAYDQLLVSLCILQNKYNWHVQPWARYVSENVCNIELS